MATLTIAERIAQIDGILAGPESLSIGDRSQSHDFAELRKERARLLRKTAATSNFRPVVFKSA